MTAFGSVPRASVWPWARWVEAKTSPSSIAWQNATAVASCPIATWKKPGKLAGAEALLDLLLEAPMSSISRRKWRRRSSRAYVFFSTLATTRFQSMLSSVSLVEELRAVESRLPKAWSQAHLKLVVSDPSSSIGPPRSSSGDAVETPRRALLHGVARRQRRRGSSTYGGSCASSTAKAWARGWKLVESVEGARATEPVRRGRWSSVDEQSRRCPPTGATSGASSSCSRRITRARRPRAGPAQTVVVRRPPGSALPLRTAFGYGALLGWSGACLRRCDRAGVRGTVRILRALSDSAPVGTQGPCGTWRPGGMTSRSLRSLPQGKPFFPHEPPSWNPRWGTSRSPTPPLRSLIG